MAYFVNDKLVRNGKSCKYVVYNITFKDSITAGHFMDIT